jgi:hypothetical protein
MPLIRASSSLAGMRAHKRIVDLQERDETHPGGLDFRGCFR